MGLDSQMERKYESIHPSLPFVCLRFKSFLILFSLFILALSLHLFYLCAAFISGTSEVRFHRFTLITSTVRLNFVLSFHQHFIFLFRPFISLLINHFDHFCIGSSTPTLSGSLRCMRGTVICRLFLVICNESELGFLRIHCWRSLLFLSQNPSALISLNIHFKYMSDEQKNHQVTFEAVNYLCFQPQTSRMLYFFMALTLSKQGKVFVWIFASNFVFISRFREKLGVKTVKALKRNNNSVTHAAIDMLCALMCVSINSVTRYLPYVYLNTLWIIVYCPALLVKIFVFVLSSQCMMIMT